jgi:hypothetical protein
MSEESVFVFDGQTKQTIEREMTKLEIVNKAEILQQLEIQKTQSNLKELARASALAKLAKLGLTEDEIESL